MEEEEKMKILRNWGGRIITANLENEGMWGMYCFMLGVAIAVIFLLLNEQ